MEPCGTPHRGQALQDRHPITQIKFCSPNWFKSLINEQVFVYVFGSEAQTECEAICHEALRAAEGRSEEEGSRVVYCCCCETSEKHLHCAGGPTSEGGLS